MQLNILTINIWRYYEWEERKEKLLAFLKEQDADVVFLQEAAYDARLKDMWGNQVQEINDQLKYPHTTFGKLMNMTEWHGEPIDWEMHYGLGMLSKYPLKEKEVVILPPVTVDKQFGFLHVVMETPKGAVDLINVHFENTTEGSKEHLRQTLAWCKERNITPLIAGDFNMKITEDLLALAEETFFISYKMKPYKSFKPTPYSNDTIPITLDYIIAHKKRFTLDAVDCIVNTISDHNPVLATITLL